MQSQSNKAADEALINNFNLLQLNNFLYTYTELKHAFSSSSYCTKYLTAADAYVNIGRQ